MCLFDYHYANDIFIVLPVQQHVRQKFQMENSLESLHRSLLIVAEIKIYFRSKLFETFPKHF